ncbi:hypothetical protein ACJJTC_003957 [Scirpophaga incertulas]
MENVNMRNRCRRKSSSLIDLSKESIFDSTMMSLPNSSLNESLNATDQYEKIQALTIRLEQCSLQLKSAHQEIENLLSENYRLKQDLNKSLTTIEHYKKLDMSNQPSGTPLLIKNKRKNKRNSVSTPLKCHIEVSTKNPEENPNAPNSETCNPYITSNLKLKGTKRKLCVISNKHYSGSLQCVEEGFSADFTVCRYLSPNSSIKQLLDGLKNKLLDYTFNDYCIVLLGLDNIYQIISNNIKIDLKKFPHSYIDSNKAIECSDITNDNFTSNNLFRI